MFRMINKLKNRKGFTLIELIVVLAVLAIIAAIAVPRFMGIQEQARIDADYSTGAMIAKAAELYAAKEPSTPTNAGQLVSKNYINGIEFQSSSFRSTSPSGVTINTSGSTITVSIGSVQLYPDTRP